MTEEEIRAIARDDIARCAEFGMSVEDMIEAYEDGQADCPIEDEERYFRILREL